MPQMTREEIAALILARLPDNTARFINPERLRDVVSAIADSVLFLGETPWTLAIASAIAAAASAYATAAQGAKADSAVQPADMAAAIAAAIAAAASGYAPTTHAHALGDVNGLVPLVLPLPAGLISGRFYDCSYAQAATTLPGFADRMEIAPFMFPRDVTIDRLAVVVSTGVASAQGKIVLYAVDASGLPADLIHESAALDFSTTGSKTAPVDLSFTTGQLVWWGVRHSSTATIRALSAGGALPLPYASPGDNGPATVLRRTLAFATPAPSAWGWNIAELTANVAMPNVRFRVA
jgi:hypothetical protein